MRKFDLFNNVSNETNVPKHEVAIIIEAALIEIKKSIVKGDNLYIRGFGSFIAKKRAAKIGRNIKKGTPVHIPEHYIPAFKPSKEFLLSVKAKKSNEQGY